jgi:hypothetical protein
LATPSADVATITAPSGDVVFFRFSFGTKVPPISKLHLLQFFGFHAVEYDKLHCGQLPCPLAVHLGSFSVKNKNEYRTSNFKKEPSPCCSPWFKSH